MEEQQDYLYKYLNSLDINDGEKKHLEEFIASILNDSKDAYLYLDKIKSDKNSMKKLLSFIDKLGELKGG